MPFSIFRKRVVDPTPTPSNGSSVAIGADNSTAAADIKNNTTSCKRKKLSNNLSTHVVNDKLHEYEEDIYITKQRWDTYPHDEPPCISSIVWQLSEEDKVIQLADYVGITEHKPFLELQDEYDVGCRQRNYMKACSAASNALEQHYARLGDNRGLVELQEDVASFKVSIDSDTNTNEEVTSAAAASDNSIVEDVGDFSFDNGGNESIGDWLGELRTDIPADVPLHDNAQSSTTTTTLKLDISCIGHGVEETRKDDGPSPTNATANLSSFTRDASPAFDSSNGSYDDGNEDALPSFNNDGVVSPKKGKAMCFVCCIL